MDEISAPKKPWNNDSPMNTNKQWFPMAPFTVFPLVIDSRWTTILCCVLLLRMLLFLGAIDRE